MHNDLCLYGNWKRQKEAKGSLSFFFFKAIGSRWFWKKSDISKRKTEGDMTCCMTCISFLREKERERKVEEEGNRDILPRGT